MVSETRHLSASINRPAADVYDYASNPANLPQWAPGLGTRVENIDAEWFVDTPSGRVGFAFVGATTTASSTMRSRCDEDFARDAGLVQADLNRLKHVLEATG